MLGWAQGGVHGDHGRSGSRTPARLTAYSKEFGASWPLLTGTPANLDALWKFLGVSVQVVPEAQPAKIDWYTGEPLTYDVNHTDGYFLIDAQGHERFSDSNPPDLHGHLDRKLTGLLNAGGLKNLDDQSLPQLDVVAGLGLAQLAGRSKHYEHREDVVVDDNNEKSEHVRRDVSPDDQVTEIAEAPKDKEANHGTP